MELLGSLITLVAFALLIAWLDRTARARTHADHSLIRTKGANDGAGELYTRPKKALDPACGTWVTTEKAKPSVHDGRVYYFCSRDCREVFEAAPDLYANPSPDNQRRLEHSRA